MTFAQERLPGFSGVRTTGKASLDTANSEKFDLDKSVLVPTLSNPGPGASE
jgi:hypothetical protein